MYKNYYFYVEESEEQNASKHFTFHQKAVSFDHYRAMVIFGILSSNISNQYSQVLVLTFTLPLYCRYEDM